MSTVLFTYFVKIPEPPLVYVNHLTNYYLVSAFSIENEGLCEPSKRLQIKMRFFTAVLIYLFVLAIRRLSGKPITEYIRKKYGKTALNTFRRTEKLSFREKKLQKDIRFLKLCKDYHVIPNFVNFRVHNPMFVYTEIYRSWCFQLLNREINRQMRKETATSKQLNNDLSLLKSTLSPIDFICISRLIKGNVDNKLRKVDIVHNKKLLNLGIDGKKKVDKNKVIFNLSNKVLTEEQKDVLAYGLDYCLPQTKIPFHRFYLYFEKLCNTIKNVIFITTTSIM